MAKNFIAAYFEQVERDLSEVESVIMRIPDDPSLVHLSQLRRVLKNKKEEFARAKSYRGWLLETDEEILDRHAKTAAIRHAFSEMVAAHTEMHKLWRKSVTELGAFKPREFLRPLRRLREAQAQLKQIRRE